MLNKNIWLNIPQLHTLNEINIKKIRDEHYADDIEIPEDILGWVENDFRKYFESGGKIKPKCWLDKITEIGIKIEKET